MVWQGSQQRSWSRPIQGKEGIVQIYVDKKPSVKDTTWTRIFHYDTVQVMESDRYYDFYKLVADGMRPKYFFGETAWMDVQRLAVDKVGQNGYNVFSR
jgi:hypothetical protein